MKLKDIIIVILLLQAMETHSSFLAPDKMHLNFNVFSYSNNDAIKYVDRDGKAPVSDVGEQRSSSNMAAASSGYPPMEEAHIREYIVEDMEMHQLGLNLGVTPFLDEFTQQMGGINWQEFQMLKNRAVFTRVNSFQEVEEIMERTVFYGGKLRFNTKRLTAKNFRMTDNFENLDKWLITEMEIRKLRDSEDFWNNTEWWRPERTWVNQEVRDLENRLHLISGNNNGIRNVHRNNVTSGMRGVNVDSDRRLMNNRNTTKLVSDRAERYVRMTSEDMRLMGITPLFWKIR